MTSPLDFTLKVSIEQYINCYRQFLIAQYMKILFEKSCEEGIYYPEEETNVGRDTPPPSEMDEDEDELYCDEAIEELFKPNTDAYHYICCDCMEQTLYSSKPPANYPHQLCLSDECIKKKLEYITPPSFIQIKPKI